MNPNLKVIQSVGILDGIHGNKLRQEIVDLIKSGTKNILLDCSQITFMDSSGLSALVMMMKSAKQVNGKFAICSLNDQLKVLLDLTSMDKVLNIVSDRDSFISELMVAQ
jgi:anti-anti-sigma factor